MPHSCSNWYENPWFNHHYKSVAELDIRYKYLEIGFFLKVEDTW